jgi:hypothetical protein
MNRVEFQNWLNAFPEDTEIHVGIQQSAPDYCPYGEVVYQKFKGEEYEDYDYTDFNGNKFATEQDWYYNKRILELGGRD